MNGPGDRAPQGPSIGGREGEPDAPCLTNGIPGTGGVLKQRPEDFLVEEIPAYEPCGEGEHLYLFVEKTNHATMHVIRLLAEHFGVRRDAVGVAGLKDKVAVTRQLFSIHLPGRRAEEFPALQREGVVIHWMDRHTNKLRRGHLAGNRFIIRVRGVQPTAVVHAHRSLSRLAAVGAPNRVGEQRFGVMRNNHLVGRALVLGDYQRVLDELLGPSARFPGAQDEARALYAQGRYAEAMERFPRSLHTERRVLAALARGAKPRGAVGSIERMIRSFYFTALQSAVFNSVLDERLKARGESGISTLCEGDLAFKHDSGAVFRVTPEMLSEGSEEAAALNRRVRGERAGEFEVSPSGPMWGHRMMRAEGSVDESELAALAAYGLTPEDLAKFAEREWDPEPGERRPLRVRVSQPDVESGVDEHGPYLKCVFELPRGSFATTVMREIMKPGPETSQPAEPTEEEAEEA